MYYDKPPPVGQALSYAQQQGAQANHPPPGSLASPECGQPQGQQVQVVATRISTEVILEYIARGLTISMTFLASMIMGTASERNDYEVTVEFSTYSALEYFLAANIIVLIYSIASLLVSIIIKSKSLILRLSNTVADIVVVSLLLTANGAASVISTQFDNIDHLYEASSCSYFSKFCSHIKASIAMSMLAVGVFLALIILSLVNFANKRN